MDCDFELLMLVIKLFELNLMATMVEVTDKETPFNRNPSPFLDFANVSPSCMATLSLLRFKICLSVWLFSTSLIQNTQIIPLQSDALPQPSSPSQHHQPHVDPLPSSLNMSPSLSSSSLGKSLDASNHVTKKKKKGKNKKMQNKEKFNQPTMVVSIGNVEETSKIR